MNPSVFNDALILTGPTASGKSAIGLLVAERLGAEIIAMDSMTLYRGMDIGTAKPTLMDRGRVPHHLVDALDPWESANLAWWLEQAESCCRNIQQRGRRALLVGGTPLYLKALLHGIFEGPPADPALRRQLEQLPGAELHARLAARDPEAARKLHLNDVRRLVRALEVVELTGRPISQWQRQFARPPNRKRPALWLELPREVLYTRIDRRVEEMLERVLLDEVRRLLALPKPLSKGARQALGYRELLDHLGGNCSLAKAVERIKTRTRNFAKRQLTWFRHLPDCRPVQVSEDDSPEQVAESVLESWRGI